MFDEPALGHGEIPDGPGLPLLHQVVYCSRAAEDVDDGAVDRIVASAQRHNPAHAISGLLVFGSGVFFQWLEGPRADVGRLMTIIRDDPRHHDVVILSETEEVRERLFPDWSMERVGPDHIREVLEDALETAQDPRNATALNRMLEALGDGPLGPIGGRA
jgi:hypothetical protein